MISINIEKGIENVTRHNFRNIKNEKIINIEKPNLPLLGVLSHGKFIVYKSVPHFAIQNSKAQGWGFFRFSIFFSEM